MTDLPPFQFPFLTQRPAMKRQRTRMNLQQDAHEATQRAMGEILEAGRKGMAANPSSLAALVRVAVLETLADAEAWCEDAHAKLTRLLERIRDDADRAERSEIMAHAATALGALERMRQAVVKAADELPEVESDEYEVADPQMPH